MKALRSGGAREVAPNIFVYSPLVLPPFGPLWQRLLNRHVLLRQLRRITRALKMKDILLWTYLPTDTAIDIIRAHRTEHSRVIYYNVADFSYLTPKSKQLEKSERELVQMSDLVFAMCTELAAGFARENENTRVFPPGVDMAAFPEPPAARDNADPLALAKLPRPLIGYVGGLHRLVDYDLIAAMARARPSWSWVFLGAQQVPLEKLEGLSNVHRFGQQPHEQLSAHMSFFDVCIVPYLNSGEMHAVVPTKINEYLAAGKAVVSTRLQTVTEFNERHHILATASTSPPEFLQAIEAQLSSAHDLDLRKQRRGVAALADWQTRIEEMSRLVEEADRESETSAHQERGAIG